MLNTSSNILKCFILCFTLMFYSTYSMSEGIRDTIYLPNKYKIKEEINGRRVYLNVDKDAYLPNSKSVYKEIKRNIKISSKIDKEPLQGNMAEIGFVISKDGSIENVKFITNICPKVDAEILKSIGQLPIFIPAQKNGKYVPMHMKLTLLFTEIKRPKDINNTTGNWSVVFPGGNNALKTYISNNLKYPMSAVENKNEGRVVIRFVINESGDVEDIRVIKSLTYDCDAESYRIVKNMPKWNPSISKGKPQKMNFTLPISFKLKNNKDQIFSKQQRKIR